MFGQETPLAGITCEGCRDFVTLLPDMPESAHQRFPDMTIIEVIAAVNLVRGTPEQAATTFGGQSTFALPQPAKDGTERFVFMADIWRPKNAIDGRYV